MKRRSLVLVTVDCLRADHVGFQGYSRPVTPFLDLLAKESVVFTNAIVAGVPTYFSVPAMLASRYPLSLGRDVVGIAPHEPTIASAMRQAGSSTAAFLAANPYLSSRFGYHEDFETFCDFLTDSLADGATLSRAAEDKSLSDFNRRVRMFSRGTHLTAAAYDELYFWYCQWRSWRENVSMDGLRRYPAADVIVDQACSWLSGIGDQPFFLWLHLMDPHYPHYPPQEALAALGLSHFTARRARVLNSAWNRDDIGPQRLRRYRERILSLYDAGVYWVDKQISRLVSALREWQRWDETIFALTADHGEEFLEQGGRYHSPVTMREELVRVPLLVRMPGVSSRTAKGPFSLIHLAPTLLEAAGIAPPDTFQGRSRWDQLSTGTDLPSELAIAESVGTGKNILRADERMRPCQMAVRGEAYKLVINFNEKAERLYDLRSDPREQSPLPAGVARAERARLLQAAREHLQKTRHNQNSDLALRARLRELRHAVS